MPRKLLIINAMLLFIAAGSVTFIVRQLASPMSMPQASRTRTAATVTGRTQEPRQQAGAYANVAARNLFSPTRTESAPTATAAAAAASPAAAKPNLFGVVLRDGAPLAYLEDPATKRVAGYQVGDSVAGGTVQTISADGVVIARPDGNMDVRLRDPSRPRPAAAAVPVAQPVAATPVLPGVIPPATGAPGAAAPGQVTIPQPQVTIPQPQPGQTGQIVTPPGVQGRRPLPPNLLRRLPQGPPTDAPQQ
jgi:hypothetical protein